MKPTCVLRGGSWGSISFIAARTMDRDWRDPSFREIIYVGVRCARVNRTPILP